MLILLADAVLLAVLATQTATAGSQIDTVADLLSELKSDDEAKREAAAARLATVRPVQGAALEALADALADRQENVRAAARHALEELSRVDGFSEAAAGLSRPPRPVKLTKPEYPKTALKGKIEGTVTVECLINRDGSVVRTRVIESVPGLDEAAQATVRTWLFTPALRDGRMVPTIANAPVKFRIY